MATNMSDVVTQARRPSWADAPVLHSKADPESDAFTANATGASRRWPPSCASGWPPPRRGGPERARRAAHRPRQAAAARPGRRAARPRLAVPRAVARWPRDGMYDGEAPGARASSPAIGRVAGRECVIVANDATVKGGTYYPITVKKHLRAQEIALQNRLPCIYLVDSGGAFLPRQDEVFPDREHFGRIFYNQATHVGRAASRRSPRCWARAPRAAPTCPAMSDEAVIVAGPGHDLPRRPAAGEGGDRRGGHAEELGGGDAARAGVRGGRPPRRGRRARAAHRPRRSSPRCAPRAAARRGTSPPAAGAAPSTRPSCTACVPADLRTPYDVREVIARLVDGSRFHEFKAALRRHAGHRLRPHLRPPGRASSPTTASCSASPRSRARTSSSCATSAASRWCSCRTSPASWSAASTRPAASPSTAPRWSPPSPAPGCPSSPWSSAARSAPATTPCAAGPTRRGSCGCGRTRGSR